ncbi:MAG: FAD-dependent oxidoreductase, partial [Celeribacter marinus]
GVNIIENDKVVRVSGTQGDITLYLESGSQIRGSHVLVATGRVANSDSLALEKGQINHNRGGITADARLRTSNRRAYAIGDVVAGNLQFTHVAGYQAGVVIRSLLFGLPAKAATHHIPRATYTSPELAQVGLSEADARSTHGNKVEVVRAQVSGNDRAIATQRADVGFIKVMVVKGRPVGVTIVGPDAGELITLWSLVLSSKLKMSQIAGMIAPYPTLAELNKRVAGAYFTPRLFESAKVKTIVKLVQRFLP